MKNYFGLFLLVFSLYGEARTDFSKKMVKETKSKSALLMLRGVVPETYKVQVSWKKNVPTARIYSNRKIPSATPVSYIKKTKGSYLVSIVHP